METCSLEWWLALLHLEIWLTSLGLAVARRTVLVWLHCAKCQVWWRGDYLLWGFVFPGTELDPLDPVKGTLNASAYQQMLDNSKLPTLCEQFCGWPLPAPTWLCTREQIKVNENMVERVRCGWTWLGCTESWPQPDRTPLGWIREEIESQAFLPNINVWPHKCKIPINKLLVESLPRSVEAVIAAKDGRTSY